MFLESNNCKAQIGWSNTAHINFCAMLDDCLHIGILHAYTLFDYLTSVPTLGENRNAGSG